MDDTYCVNPYRDSFGFCQDIEGAEATMLSVPVVSYSSSGTSRAPATQLTGQISRALYSTNATVL